MRTAGYVICVLSLSFAVACNGYNESRNASDDRNAGSIYDDSGAVGTSGTTESRDGTVRVADLMANPAAYLGQTVTVVADLEEVLGRRALVLDEDAAFRAGIDNDLLVIGQDAGKLSNIDDQWLNNRVRVTGTVGALSVLELEREIGWDLEPELEAELEHSGAILIADSIERVNR